MSLGADPSNDVILPSPGIPAVLGRLVVDEDLHASLESGHDPALEVSRPPGAEGALTEQDVLRVGEFRLAMIPAGSLDAGGDERRTRTRASRSEESGSQVRVEYSGQVFTLEPPSRLTIGSRPHNDVVIENDEFVSGAHCQITYENGEWMIVDLGSTNGTTVNGLEVEAIRLPVRATLGVGDATLRVSLGAEPEAGDDVADFHGMKAVSPVMRTLFRRLERLARAEDPVFVHGESGVGKELISRALHSASPRASKRFVAINCATLTPQLSGAELFGYCKGAFTGAEKDRAGVFEETQGGTLFLDEIAELALDVQATLLRTLETKTVRRIGSYSETPVDVRIVAASHK
ncbi:MAG: sigma-54-dependent Fis family transcriptional regulator, partial [Myxococcota bacterium]